MISSHPPAPAPRTLRLRWHLLAILVLKVAMLTALWHVFIKPNKVKVDAARMEQRMGTGAVTAPVPVKEKTP